MTDKQKILIVEDNDFVRMQMAAFLKDYTVGQATDGRNALDQLADEKYDLAVVDVRMTPMNGFEFIKAVRATKSDMAIILTSGDEGADLLSATSGLDVSLTLLKPVEKPRLLQAVERSLQVRQRRKEKAG